MRHIKQVATAQREYNWYHHVVSDCKPQNIRLTRPDILSYDFVEGTSPVPTGLWSYVHAAAEHYLWRRAVRPPTPGACRYYREYVCLKDKRLRSVLEQWVQPEHLTGAITVHGDLTLENAVWTLDQRVVFIDPGHARRLLCRELDESKLLQSLDGWHNDSTPIRPIWVRPVHLALLASHYARLIAHPELHTEHWISWAKNRLDDLLRTSSTWME